MYQPYQYAQAQEQVNFQRMFNYSPIKSFDDEGYQKPQKPADSTTPKLNIFSQYLQTNSRQMNAKENREHINFVPMNRKATHNQTDNRARHSIFDPNPRVLQCNNYQRPLRNLTPEMPVIQTRVAVNTPDVYMKQQSLAHTPTRIQTHQVYRQPVSPMNYTMPVPPSPLRTHQAQPKIVHNYQNHFNIRKVSEIVQPTSSKSPDRVVMNSMNHMSFQSKAWNQPLQQDYENVPRLSSYQDPQQQQVYAPTVEPQYAHFTVNEPKRFEDLLPQFYNPYQKKMTEQNETQEQSGSFQSVTESFTKKNIRSISTLSDNNKTPTMGNQLQQKTYHDKEISNITNISNINEAVENTANSFIKNPNYQRLQDQLMKSQQRLKHLNEMSAHYQEQRKQLQQASQKTQKFDIEPISQDRKNNRSVKASPMMCEAFEHEKLPTLQNEFDIQMDHRDYNQGSFYEQDFA